MKRFIAALAMTAVLLGNAVPALAEDPPAPLATEQTVTELPEVSITPDSPFYGLKLFVERLREFITRDAAEKAELLTKQGETRLLEATQMMEAGRPDMAADALEEAQEKFHDAQRAVNTAVEAGKQLDQLRTQLTENEAHLKLALARIVAGATGEEQDRFEAAATDVMIEFATEQDSVAELEPRLQAVLDALATESGKELAEVEDLYDEVGSVSAVATKLEIKLEVVQAAARIQIKIDGDEVKVEIKVADGTKTEIKIEEKQPKLEIKVESEKEFKNCKPHPVFKVHPGRGKKC